MIEPLRFSESKIFGPLVEEHGVVVPDISVSAVFDANLFTMGGFCSIVSEHGLVEPDTNSFLGAESKVLWRFSEGS